MGTASCRSKRTPRVSSSTLAGILEAAEKNLDDAREHAGDDCKRTHEPSEVVVDKGYHSEMVMLSRRRGRFAATLDRWIL